MAGECIDRQEAVALLSDLVRIPSVNPRMGGGPGEGELAHVLAGRLRAMGLVPTVTEVQPGRPNVVARLPGGGGGGHLLFEAHLDTVAPSDGQVDPFTPRSEGDRLFGRGACDTKASIAAMLLALQSVLSRRDLRSTISVAFTMGEEAGYEGARHLVASGFRADAAVVGEPTGLDVVVAHKGIARWRMTTLGRAAHSSNPPAGINAVVKMAGVIRGLEERLAPRLRQRSHPLLGSPTLSVGRIEGGLQVNVVPDRCRIEVDRRLLPGESWVNVRAELEAMLSTLAAEDPDLRVVIDEPFELGESMEAPLEAAVVRAARQAVRRVDGDHPARGVPFGTDAACLSGAGIPCVVLGPGHIQQAHTSQEYVELTQVMKAAAIYREMMLTF